MLIRNLEKANHPRFIRLYVHVWDGGEFTRVALFERGEDHKWKQKPTAIGWASYSQLMLGSAAYIQGKAAKMFLHDRQMRVNKDTARLVYARGHTMWRSVVRGTGISIDSHLPGSPLYGVNLPQKK